jgi:hypothetical protein
LCVMRLSARRLVSCLIVSSIIRTRVVDANECDDNEMIVQLLSYGDSSVVKIFIFTATRWTDSLLPPGLLVFVERKCTTVA